MFEIRTTAIPGLVELRATVRGDRRGALVKTFHAGFFAGHGLATAFVEQFHTISRRGVVRGMHFQVPPEDHEKLVYCIEGRVADAVVDLRVGSPAFGRHAVVELSAEAANVLYVPRGLAHGYYVVSDGARVVYNATTVHAPEHDAGVHWDSCGIAWPAGERIVSDRDAALPPLDRYSSPFRFQP